MVGRCGAWGLGSGLRGSFSSRIAAWYTNEATTTAFCFMSGAWMRSYTSMFEWCVRVSYSTGSWMNWKPGNPTASKAR